MNQALLFFPGYPPALSALARLRGAERKYAEAIELWKRECQDAPTLQNYYGLAEALDQAGRKGEAAAAYADFEQKALNRMSGPENDNRELIFYYANQARKPAEALRIARQEISQR